MNEWRGSSRELIRLTTEFGKTGKKGHGLLDEPPIQAELNSFKSEANVYDYLVILIASGQPIPPPNDGESEKQFVSRLTKLAEESVDAWMFGVGFRVNVTVTPALSLSMAQRQLRELCLKGDPYKNHVGLTGPAYDVAIEKECSISYGELPLFPHALRIGDNDYVKVGENACVTLTTAHQSGWTYNKHFWKRKNDPAQIIIRRQKLVGDAVRALATVRLAVVQLALAWPQELAELLSVIFHLEHAGMLLGDWNPTTGVRPIVEKVKVSLESAAGGMVALKHKPIPVTAQVGFREIIAAISAARPALAHLRSLN